MSPKSYVEGINSINFEAQALAVFQHQYANNVLYGDYCKALRVDPAAVNSIVKIPFLPVAFFKTHQVVTEYRAEDAKLVFESSGTTSDWPSRHFVIDASLYEASLISGFRAAFGPPEDYTFLALLPSYLERKNASLVKMAEVLMACSGKAGNGFYLDEWTELAAHLKKLQAGKSKAILLGVTFALLDFADAHPMDLRGITIMETGGMKGRREEWTREQVHTYLQERCNLQTVATEYGMTELLSQAYAQRNGMLIPAPTMRVLVRDSSDPLTVTEIGSGALNIIDLANVHSCAFIATEDMGKVHDANSFEVLGRVDHTAMRGCSLMTA